MQSKKSIFWVKTWSPPGIQYRYWNLQWMRRRGLLRLADKNWLEMHTFQGWIQSRAANFNEISNKLDEKLENRPENRLLKYFGYLAI